VATTRRIKTRTFTGTTYTAVSEREKLGMEIARELRQQAV
jgi:hypothetical protein